MDNMQRNAEPVVRMFRGHTLAVLLMLTAGGAWSAQIELGDAGSDALMANKIDAYIDCINFHSNWTQGSQARYFDWLKSPEKGPTGREQVIYGLYPLRDSTDCGKKINEAASLPPPAPQLEQAATAWIEALQALNVVVTEANTYYELENYKDDRMLKGKQLHPQLLAAFAHFNAANDAFYGQVVMTQNALSARHLARLKADPERHVDYLIAYLIDRAKLVADRIDGIGQKNFDREAFTQAVTDYEKAYFELDGYRQQHPEDQRQALKPYLFLDSALELLKSAKSVMRRERDGFKFDSGEKMLIEASAGQMVDGHPKQMIDKYNSFISSANSYANR